MDFQMQTDHDPQKGAEPSKLQNTKQDNYLNLSLPEQLFRNQCSPTKNMYDQKDLKEEPTDNDSNQDENFLNSNCDQALARSIDENTELKIYLKNKSIYITVIQTEPDHNMSNINGIINEQEKFKRNHINIYKAKVNSVKMDGYMRGLFYDVVSLFVHLKLTDQIQFNVVKNEKKIINLLLDDSCMQPNNLQNQEQFEYFLNFYMSQILPGDRLVKRICSISLSKINTEQKHIEEINETKWKKQEEKIQQLMAKIEQLQAKLSSSQRTVKNEKIENEKLEKTIKELKKIIKIFQNKNKTQVLFKQKERNKKKQQDQDHQFEKNLEKKVRITEKIKRKEKQKNGQLKKRQNIQMSIDSTPQKMKIKIQSDIYEELFNKSPQKIRNQQALKKKNDQFIIRLQNLDKKYRRQKQSSAQTILQKKNQNSIQQKQKKGEQVNPNSIISSETKNTQNLLNCSFRGQQTLQRLNKFFKSLPQAQKNVLNKQVGHQQPKDQPPSKFSLINKYISSSSTPRKIQISGDSYLKMSKQVELINVPCKCLIIHFQQNKIFNMQSKDLIHYLEADLDFRSKSIRYNAVIIFQFSVNFYSILVCEILPLAQSIQNNKNVSEFIKMLVIEHRYSLNHFSHSLGVYNSEFQPMINLINKHLLNLQEVSIRYPSGKRSCSAKGHWTAHLRKEIKVCLLGNFKSS